MATTREPIRQMLLQQVLQTTHCAETFSHATVLSCGGMYIPHHGERSEALYQIITTSCVEDPVKLVTGARPRNILHEVLIKESMN
jgi:hypothetical protein